MLYPVHWFLSLLSSVLRLGAGRGGAKPGISQPMPVLYEFEGCPWCRIAREAISEAGLSVLVRPCPKGGMRFRPKVKEMGGKAQFPYWIGDNAATGMYESGAIAKLMRGTYNAPRPLVHWLGPLNGIISSYAVLFRLGYGRNAKPAKPQEAPLEFYGSEVSPAARLVREKLCALELEYIWHTGNKPTVRLYDPNTNAEQPGARAALKFLNEHYTV